MSAHCKHADAECTPNYCECTDGNQPTPREQFQAILTGLPLLRSDVIVLFTGDGMVRASTVLELFKNQAAPLILITGGLQNPPYQVDAEHLKTYLIEQGVSPDRILVDMGSKNTRESAAHLAYTARVEGWNRLLIVTSAYHMPRCYLTVLAALRGIAQLDNTLVLPMVAHAPWFQEVAGVGQTRAALMVEEAGKVSEYQAKGHVLPYEDGLAYLAAVEMAK